MPWARTTSVRNTQGWPRRTRASPFRLTTTGPSANSPPVGGILHGGGGGLRLRGRRGGGRGVLGRGGLWRGRLAVHRPVDERALFDHEPVGHEGAPSARGGPQPQRFRPHLALELAFDLDRPRLHDGLHPARPAGPEVAGELQLTLEPPEHGEVLPGDRPGDGQVRGDGGLGSVRRMRMHARRVSRASPGGRDDGHARYAFRRPRQGTARAVRCRAWMTWSGPTPRWPRPSATRPAARARSSS